MLFFQGENFLNDPSLYMYVYLCVCLSLCASVCVRLSEYIYLRITVHVYSTYILFFIDTQIFLWAYLSEVFLFLSIFTSIIKTPANDTRTKINFEYEGYFTTVLKTVDRIYKGNEQEELLNGQNVSSHFRQMSETHKEENRKINVYCITIAA